WGAAGFERAHPRGCVQLVLDVCVAMPGSAHKGGCTNHKSLREVGDNLFAAQAVLRTENRSVAKKMRDRFHRLGRLCGFTSDDAEIKLWHFARIVRSSELHVEAVCSRNT